MSALENGSTHFDNSSGIGDPTSQKIFCPVDMMGYVIFFVQCRLMYHVKTLSDKKADVKRLVHLGTLGTYRRNVPSLHNKNVRRNSRKLKPKSFY